MESVHFPLWTYNPTTGKVKLDSADKSDTVSFFRFAPFTVTAETDTIRIINFLKFETGGIHV